MSSKARAAVQELLGTEQTYATALHTMLDAYHGPLRNEQFKLKPILAEHDIDTIFGNVEDLMVIADDLRDKLEQRIRPAAGDAVPRVGDIMCTIAPVLKLYQKYVSHFERAAQRLSECRDKTPVFAQFLDGKTAAGFMPLDSYLIMPVQRIPRYKLLLEEIIKHKPDDDEDQADLREALKKVKSQAEECNEATRRRENIQKLRGIQSRFRGLRLLARSRPALSPRRLIREYCAPDVTRAFGGMGRASCDARLRCSALLCMRNVDTSRDFCSEGPRHTCIYIYIYIYIYI